MATITGLAQLGITRRELIAVGVIGGAAVGLEAGLGVHDPEIAFADGDKQLSVYTSSSVTSLDAQNDSNSDNQEITGLLGEGLYRYDSDGLTPVPGVAESFEVSDDGLTYTFKLGDAKWSDGSDVVADDFVYGLRRLFSAELASENASSYLTYIAGAADVYNGKADSETLSVEAPDDKTLKVTMATVLPEITVLGFFSSAPTFPQKRSVIEAGGDGWSVDASSRLSNGPYKLAEYNPDVSVVLERNASYSGKAPSNADKVTFRLFSDSSASEVSMLNGELDYYKYASDTLTAQLGTSVQVENIETLTTACLFMNWRCAPLDNPKVREAIYLAIDPDYTNSVLESGLAAVARGFIGDKFSDPAGGSFRTDANALIPDFSDDVLAQARQALSDAGYPNGEGLPTLVYLTSDSTRGVQRAQFFQALLKDNLGISVDVESYDAPTYLSMIGGSDYAFSYMSLNASCDNAIEMFANFTTDSDLFGVAIPDFDDLMAQIQSEADATKQSELMHQAEQMLLTDNHAFRPVVYGYEVNAYASDVSGIVTDPTGLDMVNYMTKTGW